MKIIEEISLKALVTRRQRRLPGINIQKSHNRIVINSQASKKIGAKEGDYVRFYLIENNGANGIGLKIVNSSEGFRLSRDSSFVSKELAQKIIKHVGDKDGNLKSIRLDLSPRKAHVYADLELWTAFPYKIK